MTTEQKIDAIYRELENRTDLYTALMLYLVRNDPNYPDVNPPLASKEFLVKLGFDPSLINDSIALQLAGYIEMMLEEKNKPKTITITDSSGVVTVKSDKRKRLDMAAGYKEDLSDLNPSFGCLNYPCEPFSNDLKTYSQMVSYSNPECEERIDDEILIQANKYFVDAEKAGHDMTGTIYNRLIKSKIFQEREIYITFVKHSDYIEVSQRYVKYPDDPDYSSVVKQEDESVNLKTVKDLENELSQMMGVDKDKVITGEAVAFKTSDLWDSLKNMCR